VTLVGRAYVYSGWGVSGSYLSREVEACNWSLSIFLFCWSWLVSGNYSWHLRLYIAVIIEHNLTLLLALSCVF